MNRHRLQCGALALVAGLGVAASANAQHSVARQWNEALLDGIRGDFARPTVHARNLFHTSVVMWDAWAAYDDVADQWLHDERQEAVDVQAAREEAISYAMYRLLRHRFAGSPNAAATLAEFDALMVDLGYDINITTTVGDTPAALGNRIAQEMILWGFTDGANEGDGYANQWYAPVNPPLLPDLPGNPDMVDPNRWQPLALDFFIDQGGNVIVGGFPPFLSPEWGQVEPFALKAQDLTVYNRDGFDYLVYHDPGTPPLFGGPNDDEYKWGYELVAIWSGHLDPSLPAMVDCSPAGIGGIPFESIPTSIEDYDQFYDIINGGDTSPGYAVNPVTGQPYQSQMIKLGDYGRILAEFWADGPHSETPPGHWFTILNYVADHPEHVNQIGGEGPILDQLEWDVKAYLALGGAMHDVAISAWGVKGWYDYPRPVSAIRYLADRGQSSDPMQPSYDPEGIRLYPGKIEVVTNDTIQPGERHEHLAGPNNENVGKIALFAWRGPDYISDPETDTAGAGWILAENWWPYQRPTFVTPPFAGYVSGHSTYSRAAAELMTLLTGSPYFPGGVGVFEAPMNEYLVFEEGPTQDITLEWASYSDASDQCSLSRIWGGIHPPADDIPGRHMGRLIGPDAYVLAERYWNGQITCPANWNGDGAVDSGDFFAFIAGFVAGDADFNLDRVTDSGDFFGFISAFLNGC